MDKEREIKHINSTNENVKDSELIIQQLSERLINDLKMGHWEYIEWRDCYLQELDGADKFPNKIAYDMIKAWRWDEVFRHIDKFEPTQTLAKALLKDMLKNWFYENLEDRDVGYHGNLLEDNIVEWENFLSRFENLDNTTAILVLKLLEKNMYEWAGCVYKEHLWDCFNLEYFTGLDEGVLKIISERWKIPTDEEKKRFIWIDEEKRKKYTKIALDVQKNRDDEWDELAQELEELY